ncbi:MAG: DNA polymerase III subunit beta [Magnetococcales bacterium]|nr:DNA polymerase III subunit beta [Magnetococcales bacterium]
MELYVEREPFLKALGRIQTVVERRNTRPVLANARLEANGEFLAIAATDTEVSITTRCPAEVEHSGGLTVSARKLYEIVRELPDKPLLLRQDGDERLTISCDQARFHLVGLALDQFPDIPEMEGGFRFSMSTGDLADMFAKTHFAISTDEGRYTLNGVLLQADPPKPDSPETVARLRMVATDTHRLSIVENPIPEEAGRVENPIEAILPKKAVQEIRKLLEEGEANVELTLGERQVRFALPEMTLIANLVEGRFPNYKRVIPEGNKLLLNIPKDPLLAVVKRMSVLSNEKSRGIRMQILPDRLKVTTTNPEQEAAQEEMLTTFDGPGMSLGFNARYLLEILTVIGGETIRFHLLDEDSSVLLTDPEKNNFLFVLMPMRI